MKSTWVSKVCLHFSGLRWSDIQISETFSLISWKIQTRFQVHLKANLLIIYNSRFERLWCSPRMPSSEASLALLISFHFNNSILILSPSTSSPRDVDLQAIGVANRFGQPGVCSSLVMHTTSSCSSFVPNRHSARSDIDYSLITSSPERLIAVCLVSVDSSES